MVLFNKLNILFEVAENARKAVEASYDVLNRAFLLVNQEHRSLDVLEKALARILKEAKVIESETKKAQNTVIVVQKAANEAKSNGPDLPQTEEVVGFVNKVADEVRIAVKIAMSCPAIVDKATQILDERKTITHYLNADLDTLLT